MQNNHHNPHATSRPSQRRRRSSYSTPSQAWAILARHARDEMAPLRLQELCRDSDRVASLVAVCNTVYCARKSSHLLVNRGGNESENRILILDLSRQRMTLETIHHLLRLASARQLRQTITRLAWGQNCPSNPVLPLRVRKPGHVDTDESPLQLLSKDPPMPSMHMALRVPPGHGYEMLAASDGTNVLMSIHQEWERLEKLSNALRRGQSRGVTGQLMRDIVVIGRGVPLATLRFVDQALAVDERATVARRVGLTDRNFLTTLQNNHRTTTTRRLHYLTRMDPLAAAAVVTDCDPACTLVISLALNGNEETGLATKTLKTWLLQALVGRSTTSDAILSKHMMLVTGNDHIANLINRPDSVHRIPDHSRCEAFLSCSAACLLPLSIVFGWPIVEDFLSGAHHMDKHFVDTNPRHNLPVLLALTDIWNETLLHAPTRISIPCADGLAGYPALSAALEAQACSHGSGDKGSSNAPLVVDGGLDGAYDRLVFQSPIALPNELLAVMDHQMHFGVARSTLLGNNSQQQWTDMDAAQDAVLCSVLAHADELAFGTTTTNKSHAEESSSSAAESSTEGNRPSTLLICGKLDAYACGQLVALAEHRALVKAHICETDPFVRQVGSSLRASRADHLLTQLHMIRAKNAAGTVIEDEPGGNNPLILSTKTILEHYASLDQPV